MGKPCGIQWEITNSIISFGQGVDWIQQAQCKPTSYFDHEIILRRLIPVVCHICVLSYTTHRQVFPRYIFRFAKSHHQTFFCIKIDPVKTYPCI
jgi:hypothetical protein